jgi:hypothetical protein
MNVNKADSIRAVNKASTPQMCPGPWMGDVMSIWRMGDGCLH